MMISAMSTKYRDFAFLLTFGIQLLIYGTTVIYPLSAVSDKYRRLIAANPMTTLMETFRFGFPGKGTFSWHSLAFSTTISLIFLFAGTTIVNKVEKNCVDIVQLIITAY